MKTFPYLKEFVYGGIDGSVTTFAVVAGATGANMSSGVIIVLGFANLIADGFSMSVGNYLSEKSAMASNKELSIAPGRKSAFQTASATFFSFIAMGFIPIFVYVLGYTKAIGMKHLFVISTTLTFSTFIFIGFLRSYVAHTSIIKSIGETLFLGGIASILSYYVGTALQNML